MEVEGRKGKEIQWFVAGSERVVTPEEPRETMPAVAYTTWVIYIDIIRRSRRRIVARPRPNIRVGVHCS
jgi:hypothetical protein